MDLKGEKRRHVQKIVDANRALRKNSRSREGAIIGAATGFGLAGPIGIIPGYQVGRTIGMYEYKKPKRKP